MVMFPQKAPILQSDAVKFMFLASLLGPGIRANKSNNSDLESFLDMTSDLTSLPELQVSP